jgi:hypothetical protein
MDGWMVRGISERGSHQVLLAFDRGRCHNHVAPNADRRRRHSQAKNADQQEIECDVNIVKEHWTQYDYMEDFGQENNCRASWLAVFYDLAVDSGKDYKEDNAEIHN